MRLEIRAVPPFQKNGFVVWCEKSRDAVLIDPGDEVEELVDIVEQNGLSVKYILLTHAHFDHISGVSRAKAKFGAPIYLHPGDRFFYENAVQQAALFGVQIEATPPVDQFYDGEGPLTFGDYEIRVHHTPGHCAGGVCLQAGPSGQAGKQLFVGDTLFAGSIGRTDLFGGDYDALIRSITTVLFAFGDDADVYPGHGPKTTIGYERRTNPFVRQ